MVREKMNTKLIESVRRYKEHSLKLKETRRCVLFIAAPHPEQQKVTKCAAKTLEGRQCPFKASAGGCFCKKHTNMI